MTNALFANVDLASLGPAAPGRFILAGTGSRQLQVADRAVKVAAAGRVEELVRAARDDHPGLVVMSGMAEGFDKLLALTALRLDVPLWCAIPNRGYGDFYWSARRSLTGEDRRAEFNGIVAAASSVTFVMELVGSDGLYAGGLHANLVRNLLMVELANRFLVWDPSSAGTRHCLAAVRAAGVDFEIVSLPGA